VSVRVFDILISLVPIHTPQNRDCYEPSWHSNRQAANGECR
jgi:hypothetical protein